MRKYTRRNRAYSATRFNGEINNSSNGGNYYNVLTNNTLPVRGAVDKKTQRAAWTVGDRKEPIYEVGVANLTKSETTMLVHFGKDRTQQWSLIRIEQPEEKK